MNSADKASLEDVIAAYGLLLNRRPEDSMLASYGDLVRRGVLTRKQLVESLLKSNEYRVKSGNCVDTTPFAVEIDDFKVFVRRSDRDIGLAIASKLGYEPNVVSPFRELVTAGMRVLDIGANIGFYTMLAARLVGPQGKVFAIEPADKNVQLICAGATANHFDNIEIFPLAAGSRNEIVGVQTHANTSNCELHDIAEHGPALAGYAIVRKLDDLLSTVDRIDVVKIDVEGFEPRAFQGMTQLLSRSRPAIFTEFHPQALLRNSGTEAREYARTLFALGNDVVSLDRDGSQYRCESPEHVLERWESANERAGLPGSLHLDLLVRD